MTKGAQPGEVMETCCDQCHSRFRISDEQLKAALGKARCGECGKIFDALQSLKSIEGLLPPGFLRSATEEVELLSESKPGISLHEAMYGSKRGVFSGFSSLF